MRIRVHRSRRTIGSGNRDERGDAGADRLACCRPAGSISIAMMSQLAPSTQLDPRPVSRPFSALGGNESKWADDWNLVQAASARDSDSIEALVQRLRIVPCILSALNKKQGRFLDENDLLDLAQDVAVIVWTKLPSFRAEGALESWLYGVTYLEYRNACGRKARLRHHTSETLQDAAGSVAREGESSNVPIEDVERGLETLDPDERDLIRLRYEESLTFDAIAERLGQPANTLKARFHRSLAKLRATLELQRRREDHRR
jgi:RNA polymerase sigma-70 factor (ECF subfamily)